MSFADAPVVCEYPLDDAVRHALQRSGYGELLDLDVSSRDGRVRLNGSVRSFFLKQKAQTLAMSVAGVERLENEVVVQ